MMEEGVGPWKHHITWPWPPEFDVLFVTGMVWDQQVFPAYDKLGIFYFSSSSSSLGIYKYD